MLERWIRFYDETYNKNPENLSAKGRAELMRHCAHLFAQQDTGDA